MKFIVSKFGSWGNCGRLIKSFEQQKMQPQPTLDFPMFIIHGFAKPL